MVIFTFFIAQIPVPEMIEAYNDNMGGVDLVDNMVACYRYSNCNILVFYKVYIFCFLSFSVFIAGFHLMSVPKRL